MRLYLTLVLTIGSLGLAGCEEEPPPPPRGGGPAGAEPAADPAGATDPNAPATKPGAAAGATGAPAATGTDPAPAAGTDPAAAPGTDPAAKGAPKAAAKPEVPKKPETRAPTASEMLGLGKRRNASGSGLPDFVKSGKVDGPNPLFAGRIVQPSGRYQKMRVDSLDGVSPIVRHWGSEQELTGGDKAKGGVLAAPVGATPSSLFKKSPSGSPGAGADAKKAADTGKPARVAAETERKFPLLLYRLDRATGQVEVFDRTYASTEAHRAAKQFAMRQGYKPNKPTSREVTAIKKAHQARERAAQEAACQFRAQWTEGNVRQSRCFPSQKAVDLFMAAKRASEAAAAARAAAKKKAAATPAAPTRPARPTPPAPQDNNSLKPVPIR